MKNLISYNDRMTMVAMLLIGIGIALRYSIGKRRFNRRGIAGMQQFKTYKKALLIATIERLVNIIATLLIISGAILYLIK